MPDHRHMGQSAHLRLRLVPSRAARRVAIGTAASVAAALTVSGCAGSLASATTTLQGVIDVTVVHRSGIEVAAVEGLRLRPGDLVRTGPGGRADLVTRSRHVYLGSEGSVQVLDGA